MFGYPFFNLVSDCASDGLGKNIRRQMTLKRTYLLFFQKNKIWYKHKIGDNNGMEWDWESGRIFRFYQGRLKVIFLIISKVTASFPSPSYQTFGSIGNGAHDLIAAE